MKYKNYSLAVLREIDSVLTNLKLNDISIVVSLLKDCFLNKRTIITVGAGRMGLAAKAFSMRLKHLDFNSWSLGDTSLPKTGAEDILFVVSGSGETPTIKILCEQAKKYNQKIILLTCNNNSSIAKLSNCCITLPTTSTLANNANSIQLMKTLVEQCAFIFLDILTLILVDELNLSKEKICSNHSILE